MTTAPQHPPNFLVTPLIPLMAIHTAPPCSTLDASSSGSEVATSLCFHDILAHLRWAKTALYIAVVALWASDARASDQFPTEIEKEEIKLIKDFCGIPSKNLECIEILSKSTHPETYLSQTAVAFSSLISGPASSFSGVASKFIFTTTSLSSKGFESDLANSYQVNGDPLPASIFKLLIRIGIGYQVEAKGYSAKISAPFTAALLPGSLGLNPESNYLEAKFAGIAPNNLPQNLEDINCKKTKDFSEKFSCAIPSLPSIDEASFTKISSTYNQILNEAIKTKDSDISVCPQVLEIFAQKNEATNKINSLIRIRASAGLIKNLQSHYESNACKDIQTNGRVKFSNGKNSNDLNFDTASTHASSSIAEYIYARNHYFYPATYCNPDSTTFCAHLDSYSRFWISTKDDSANSPSILAAVFSAKSKAQSVDIHTHSQLGFMKTSIVSKIPSEANLTSNPSASLEDLANQMKLTVDYNAALFQKTSK